jgi:hypothetical protein
MWTKAVTPIPVSFDFFSHSKKQRERTKNAHVIITPCTTFCNPWRTPQITADANATQSVSRSNRFNTHRIGNMMNDSTKGAKKRTATIKKLRGISIDGGSYPRSKAMPTAIGPTTRVGMMLMSHARHT